MSECVVRMEMSENCDECPMCGTASGGNGMYKLWCMCGDIPASVQRIPNDCPIICSLPEGHGRLVDMNDVEGMFEAAQIISDDDCNCGYVTDDLRIEELPTIVPADTAERSET